MKFGKVLEQETYPPFAEGYVRYNELKASIASEEVGFGEKLRAEVERVADFGDRLKQEKFQQLEALEKRWKDVKEWKQSGFPDVDKDVEKTYAEFTQLALEINRVLDFVSLNVTGIRKICKKHDRRTGEVSGPMLLSKLQRDAETAYLDRLSDPQQLEELVTRCKDAMDEIQDVRAKAGQEISRRRELAPAKGPDYFAIPRSREASINSSASSSSYAHIGTRTSTPSMLDDLIPANCVDTLAKPLLSSERVVGGEERPITAIAGAFLAGVGFGGFWTICEVVLSPWAATIAVLIASCGSITGTRPALSNMYYHMFAFAGAAGALLFISTDGGRVTNRHSLVDMLCAWLNGVCVGAWTVQVPRQLVSASGSSSRVRALVTFAPLLGSCFGAMMLLLVQVPVAIFAQAYSFAWVVFFLFITLIRPLTPDAVFGDGHSERGGSEAGPSSVAPPQAGVATGARAGRGSGHSPTADGTDLESEAEDMEMGLRAPSRSISKSWKQASSHVVTLGLLSSLAVDRTVRTLIALEVVSFFPALWGEDFFLLSLGSIVASFVGAVVPSWLCALVGCLSIYLLGGPGFVAWTWAEASCRNDLAKFSSESAPTADTILYVADFTACVVFAIELSYLENPNDTPVGVNFASGLLLLASSLGRLCLLYTSPSPRD